MSQISTSVICFLSASPAASASINVSTLPAVSIVSAQMAMTLPEMAAAAQVTSYPVSEGNV